MNDLSKWVASFVLSAVLVVICYVWVDRPVALLAHEVYRLDLLALTGNRVPIVIAPVAAVAFVVFAARALLNRPLPRPLLVIVLCALSYFVTEGLTLYLKGAAGRTWPESWMDGRNPSFVRDGVYGFFPFHSGAAYTSFPSGHTAVACAILSVLWAWYPRFRSLYALLIAATAVGLVVTNFHFVSDVIAGMFLGTSVGWITTAMWKAGVEPSAKLP
jgi:membrane-associated phospholipid phosphatase